MGRTLGINPQRMEMIPLDIAQFASTEVFWLNKSMRESKEEHLRELPVQRWLTEVPDSFPGWETGQRVYRDQSWRGFAWSSRVIPKRILERIK